MHAFIDFECPFCQANYPTIKGIIKKYDPAVNLVFKHLPLTSIHPRALDAALASTCANEQEKFWEYHDLLFETKQLDNASLFATANKLNLDKDKFSSCFTNKKYLTQINKDSKDAVAAKLRGTPTHIVNGEIIEGVKTTEEWDKIIIKHLNK